jgi:hypothetical protein
MLLKDRCYPCIESWQAHRFIHGGETMRLWWSQSLLWASHHWHHINAANQSTCQRQPIGNYGLELSAHFRRAPGIVHTGIEKEVILKPVMAHLGFGTP